MNHYQTHECADRRDKAFALLVLVEWNGVAPIVSDYTNSTFVVACKVISYSCQTEPRQRLQYRRVLLDMQMILVREVMASMRMGPNDPAHGQNPYAKERRSVKNILCRADDHIP